LALAWVGVGCNDHRGHRGGPYGCVPLGLRDVLGIEAARRELVRLDHRPAGGSGAAHDVRPDPLLRSIPKVSTDPLDLVGLLIALFAFVVRKEIAATVGPDAAVIVLACAGAAVARSGHEKMSAREACWYVTWRAFVAVAVTVMLAELLQIGF